MRMPRHVLIPLALCAAIFHSVSLADEKIPKDPKHKSTSATTTLPIEVTVNVTSADNDTATEENVPKSTFGIIADFAKNKAMLLRTFYVLIAVTAVVVLYFVIKSAMIRRNKNKTRKYGIVNTPASALEMQPLDQGDDDDDMTLFEARSSKLK